MLSYISKCIVDDKTIRCCNIFRSAALNGLVVYISTADARVHTYATDVTLYPVLSKYMRR